MTVSGVTMVPWRIRSFVPERTMTGGPPSAIGVHTVPWQTRFGPQLVPLAGLPPEHKQLAENFSPAVQGLPSSHAPPAAQPLLGLPCVHAIAALDQPPPSGCRPKHCPTLLET